MDVLKIAVGYLILLRLSKTRSSWLNCALRDDEAVYWVSIGHYEAVAVGNWWYWVSRGHSCLYILQKVEISTGVTDAWLTDSLTTLKDSATQRLIEYKSGALVTQLQFNLKVKRVCTCLLVWFLLLWTIWELSIEFDIYFFPQAFEANASSSGGKLSVNDQEICASTVQIEIVHKSKQ